jgi:type III secretory pathway component EscT
MNWVQSLSPNLALVLSHSAQHESVWQRIQPFLLNEWLSVLLIAVVLWSLVGHWLFLRYMHSGLIARAWFEYAMFFLSGPVTWIRFWRLLRK